MILLYYGDNWGNSSNIPTMQCYLLASQLIFIYDEFYERPQAASSRSSRSSEESLWSSVKFGPPELWGDYRLRYVLNASTVGILEDFSIYLSFDLHSYTAAPL